MNKFVTDCITAVSILWLGFWVMAGGYALVRVAISQPKPMAIVGLIFFLMCAAVAWLTRDDFA